MIRRIREESLFRVKILFRSREKGIFRKGPILLPASGVGASGMERDGFVRAYSPKPFPEAP